LKKVGYSFFCDRKSLYGLRAGTDFNIPVTYCSALMSVAYGRVVKGLALEGQVIRAKLLENIANK